ncbi:MAG: hypothetical protein DRH12_10795 [Deltaproteobacteria bacterium]|nr:MAG: hypothetical protein DRH12_10795 [Deltaproteobacteria bacterium]
MEPIKETMRALLQEMILPELKDIKDTLIRHEERLNSMDKRIGDINTHLIDQSRRIDEVREELSRRIDEVREELSRRIDETNKSLNARIDRLYDVIVRRDEHTKLDERVTRLERDVQELKAKIAA